MESDNVLRSSTEEVYGNNFKAHYLEQYKLYVEMTDRISTKRQHSNTFFLTVNSALILMSSYLQLGNSPATSSSLFWLISILGITLCYSWHRLIRSYKDINTGKFKIIHAMEKHLPTSPYQSEWDALGQGKKADIYLPFTKIETAIPWTFFVIHLFVLLQFLPLTKIYELL